MIIKIYYKRKISIKDLRKLKLILNIKKLNHLSFALKIITLKNKKNILIFIKNNLNLI